MNHTLLNRHLSTDSFLIFALLSLSILATAAPSSFRLLFYLLFAGFLTLLLLHYLIISGGKITIVGKIPTILFIAFSFILVFTTARAGEIDNLFTILLLLYSLVVFLYIVPSLIEYETFLHWLSFVAAFLGGLGMLSVIIGEFELLFLSIDFHGGYQISIPGTEMSTYRVRSVFGNPNGLAYLTGAGGLASLFLFYMDKSMIYAMNLGILIIATYLTGSRSGLLILSIGTVTFIFAHILSALKFQNGIRIISDAIFGAVILLILSVLITPINILQLLPVDFTNRLILWDATAQVIRSNWITGIGYTLDSEAIAPLVPDRFRGQSPHNSFLRIFLHTGVFGGIIYIAFQYSIINLLSQSLFNSTNISIFSLSLPLIFIQAFETYSILGFAHQSVIFALAFGYGIQHLNDNQPDYDS